MVSCRAVFDVALEFARAGGAPHRILDGNVIEADRCREKALSGTSAVRSGRRSPFGILASTLTVALIAVVATAVSGGAASASVRATSPQKAGMAELMKSFNPRTGLIGSVWWQAAVALSTVETYQQATGDTAYRNVIFTAFKGHKRGNFENSYNDDTGWWGLAWLQAYDITRTSRYLVMAETDANYMHRSWDGTCRGGVYWTTTKAYKNAITNEVFLELTAWLHNTIRGDTKYLRWAKAEWSWFKGSGMINKSDLINDGLNARCANNHKTAWTYNQGVILAGLAQLYRATKTPGLLRTAQRIAKAAISHLTIGGVLHERCRGTGCGNRTGGARESFKGIFVRDLKVLAVTARTSQFSSFFRKQARSIEAHDANRHHQFGLLWAGPIIDLNPHTQASAEDALVAALNWSHRKNRTGGVGRTLPRAERWESRRQGLLLSALPLLTSPVGHDGVRPPWPAACQLYLQREAQERADRHDDGQYCHAGESGLNGDSADDVADYLQLQAQQDRPAQLLAKGAEDAGLMMAQPDGGSTGADHHAVTMTTTPAASMTSPIRSIAWL